MNTSDLGLYLVADPDQCSGDPGDAVEQAVRGGVTCVQLRAKSLSDRAHLALAVRLRLICRAAEVPFLVNDRFDIAILADADGVHLGVDDVPPLHVRKTARDGFIIGFSPDSDHQIRCAAENGIDYLGVGPIFGTASKPDAGSALGIAEFSRRCAISPVPVVGIGGISTANARSVRRAGASGVAAVSAILGSDDPASAAAALLD